MACGCSAAGGAQRLGVPARAGKRAWAGFSALGETVAERLLEEGGHDAADARATLGVAAERIADDRHVLGGECTAVADTARATAEAAECVRRMQQLVASAGGRASTLMEQLGAAYAYLRASTARRQSMSEQHWHAWRRVVAADLDGPDWPMAQHGGHEAEEKARAELAKELAKLGQAAGQCCEGLRRGWLHTASAEIEYRDQQEAMREWFRLVLRAWREQADGARAGERAWGARWLRQRAGGGGCALGARLRVSTGSAAAPGFANARAVLEWMRLVRAGDVLAARGEHRRAQRPRGQPAAPQGGGGAAPGGAQLTAIAPVGPTSATGHAPAAKKLDVLACTGVVRATHARRSDAPLVLPRAARRRMVAALVARGPPAPIREPFGDG